MGYVDSHLLQGETVVYRTKLHKILFLWPGLIAIVFCLLAGWLYQNAYDTNWVILSIAAAILILLPSYIQYISCEYAVTNKRVIVKVGFIRRQTMETLLQKIEAIGVDQSIMGRMLNYGSIAVIGTGGTKEIFDSINDPLAFRRSVQEQTDARDRSSET